MSAVDTGAGVSPWRHLTVKDLLRIFPRPAPGADLIAWLTVDQEAYDELIARRLSVDNNSPSAL